ILAAGAGDAIANRWRVRAGCATILRAEGVERTEVSMDKLDARILDLLQTNGELTAAEIADRVGLSKVPCWRRIQKLQKEGGGRPTLGLLDASAPHPGPTG